MPILHIKRGGAGAATLTPPQIQSFTQTVEWETGRPYADGDVIHRAETRSNAGPGGVDTKGDMRAWEVPAGQAHTAATFAADRDAGRWVDNGPAPAVQPDPVDMFWRNSTQYSTGDEVLAVPATSTPGVGGRLRLLRANSDHTSQATNALRDVVYANRWVEVWDESPGQNSAQREPNAARVNGATLFWDTTGRGQGEEMTLYSAAPVTTTEFLWVAVPTGLTVRDFSGVGNSLMTADVVNDNGRDHYILRDEGRAWAIRQSGTVVQIRREDDLGRVFGPYADYTELTSAAAATADGPFLDTDTATTLSPDIAWLYDGTDWTPLGAGSLRFALRTDSPATNWPILRADVRDGGGNTVPTPGIYDADTATVFANFTGGSWQNMFLVVDNADRQIDGFDVTANNFSRVAPMLFEVRADGQLIQSGDLNDHLPVTATAATARIPLPAPTQARQVQFYVFKSGEAGTSWRAIEVAPYGGVTRARVVLPQADGTYQDGDEAATVIDPVETLEPALVGGTWTLDDTVTPVEWVLEPERGIVSNIESSTTFPALTDTTAIILDYIGTDEDGPGLYERDATSPTGWTALGAAPDPVDIPNAVYTPGDSYLLATSGALVGPPPAGETGRWVYTVNNDFTATNVGPEADDIAADVTAGHLTPQGVIEGRPAFMQVLAGGDEIYPEDFLTDAGSFGVFVGGVGGGAMRTRAPGNGGALTHVVTHTGTTHNGPTPVHSSLDLTFPVLDGQTFLFQRDTDDAGLIHWVTLGAAPEPTTRTLLSVDGMTAAHGDEILLQPGHTVLLPVTPPDPPDGLPQIKFAPLTETWETTTALRDLQGATADTLTEVSGSDWISYTYISVTNHWALQSGAGGPEAIDFFVNALVDRPAIGDVKPGQQVRVTSTGQVFQAFGPLNGTPTHWERISVL